MKTSTHMPTYRVVAAIDLLSEQPDGLRLSEISTQLQMPKSSLLPILRELVYAGYLRCSQDTQKYKLGIKCAELGERYVQQTDFIEEARAVIRKVVQMCDETCHFAVLDGMNVLYLLKEESNQTIRMSSSIGKRLPAYSAAVGKSLLTKFSTEEIRAMYADGLAPVTEKTITEIDRLCEQVERARIEKFSYESEESSEHITCVAVPIERRGTAIAAVSASMPIFRATEEKMALVRSALKEAKNDIEKIASNVPFEF